MADAGPQAPAVLASQTPQALQQPAQQAQHAPQLNWSFLSLSSWESQKKMQRHIYLEQMIGWTLINSKRGESPKMLSYISRRSQIMI